MKSWSCLVSGVLRVALETARKDRDRIDAEIRRLESEIKIAEVHEKQAQERRYKVLGEVRE